MPRFLHIMILTIALASCASFTKARLSNAGMVRPGQTPEEVVATLGEPKSKMMDGEAEIWIYNLIDDDSRHYYPYRARFKKHILEAFYQGGNEIGKSPDGGGRRHAGGAALSP